MLKPSSSESLVESWWRIWWRVWWRVWWKVIGWLLEVAGVFFKKIGERLEEAGGNRRGVFVVRENLQSASENLVSASENLVSASENLVSASENLVSVSENLQSASENLQSASENLQSASASASAAVSVSVSGRPGKKGPDRRTRGRVRDRTPPPLTTGWSKKF
jgi:hypothetical protein